MRVEYRGWDTVSALKERLITSDSATLASDLVSVLYI